MTKSRSISSAIVEPAESDEQIVLLEGCTFLGSGRCNELPQQIDKDAVHEKLDKALEFLFVDANEGSATAHEKLAQLAARGVVSAQFGFGQLEAISGNNESAARWWKLASSKDYGRATFGLGNLLDRAGLNDAEIDTLVGYYRLAIEQGYVTPESRTRLARAMLRRGQFQDCPVIRENLVTASELSSEARNVLSGEEFKKNCPSPKELQELIGRVIKAADGKIDVVLSSPELGSVEPIPTVNKALARDLNNGGLTALPGGDFASAEDKFAHAANQNWMDIEISIHSDMFSYCKAKLTKQNAHW